MPKAFSKDDFFLTQVTKNDNLKTAESGDVRQWLKYRFQRIDLNVNNGSISS